MNRFEVYKRLAWSVLVVGMLAFAVSGCEGDRGPAGADGQPGTDGTNGTDGTDGTDGAAGADGADGQDGQDGGDVSIANFHGSDYLLSTGEFETAGKFFANATITSATADANGLATVNFTVEDQNSDPVTTLTGANFSIAALAPASGTESYNKWVPYIYRTETVAAPDPTNPDHDWPAATGTQAEQAYRESNGTFTNNGGGSYTYVFATDLSNATTPVTGQAIPYDRSLTHRVSVMIGGHSGPTADANFDFVPDGSAITETRNIVETSTCQNCHGMNDFHGHGGDRLTVENCVTCHAPGSFDAQGGESVDMKVMIHKIHAGGELATIPGLDGIVWDNPSTAIDESADNGEYAIWGYRSSKHEWWKAVFPAVLANCTACHNGMGADVDNWMDVPSAAVCESCHDDVDVSAGLNHPAAVTDDNACGFCHVPTGSSLAVADAHDWLDPLSPDTDQRNIPEFEIDLTISDPANGTHFVAGETPVVTIVINEGGNPIDHTTIVPDAVDEGCDPIGCVARDGAFDRVYLLVHGPRGKRNPVLSTPARAEIVSAAAGPFDLSGATGLDLIVDNGREVLLSSNGGQRLSGVISVDFDAAAFANPAAATHAEIVAWLNADSDFAARAIAYLDNGFAAIRSRNLGEFYAVQLEAGNVTTAVFGGDTGVKVVGGFYPRASLLFYPDPADRDPKASWFADRIEYELDPVDDLQPGTYIASVEITDRGRISGSNYKTPSVAKAAFQVGQAAEELAVAGNCGMCHQGPDGRGFILDFSRHYKIFDNTAVDQCGGCHDYQSQSATGEFGGGRPISKRVHAVHHGSELHFPLLTVDYVGGESVPGRNWEIHFPQDIRNCETCHPANTTSGSWATNPNRLACMGCHDKESTSAHIKLQTFDPTPTSPWNGDEEESCDICH